MLLAIGPSKQTTVKVLPGLQDPNGGTNGGTICCLVLKTLGFMGAGVLHSVDPSAINRTGAAGVFVGHLKLCTTALLFDHRPLTAEATGCSRPVVVCEASAGYYGNAAIGAGGCCLAGSR